MRNRYYYTIVKEVSNKVHRLANSKRVILIGIDGCGGSGKSTFAAELSEFLDSAPIVHMDDFYKSSKERNKESSPNSIGWQFDWQRLEKEVLQPLTTSGVATYRRYDWNEDCLTDVLSVRVDSSVIIEGIYSLRPELTSYYDMRLWVEGSKEIRLQRGIVRDGEQARSQWEDNWMKEEEEYVSTYHPYLHVDRIINGMPPLTLRSSQRARGKPR